MDLPIGKTEIRKNFFGPAMVAMAMAGNPKTLEVDAFFASHIREGAGVITSLKEKKAQYFIGAESELFYLRNFQSS